MTPMNLKNMSSRIHENQIHDRDPHDTLWVVLTHVDQDNLFEYMQSTGTKALQNDSKRLHMLEGGP